MRVAIINTTPERWLRGIGESDADVAQILASFEKGATPRVCVFRSEHLFLRFHGAKARKRIFQPNYWVDGSALASAFGRAGQFEHWLTDAEIGRAAKCYYRDLAAICHNWNDLRDEKLWKIELRGGETVEGLEGPVASQPTFAAARGLPATTSLLRGGAVQVYLDPRTSFVCTPVVWPAA